MVVVDDEVVVVVVVANTTNDCEWATWDIRQKVMLLVVAMSNSSNSNRAKKNENNDRTNDFVYLHFVERRNCTCIESSLD